MSCENFQYPSPASPDACIKCVLAGVSCTVQVEMIYKNGNAKTYTSCNTHQSDAAEVDVTRTESTDAELTNEGDLLQITGFSCTVQVEICKNGTYTSCNKTHQRDAAEAEHRCVTCTDTEPNEGDFIVIGRCAFPVSKMYVKS
ncbi:hypothetical protein EMCRGX_G021790 [Ephydatia muelleri]